MLRFPRGQLPVRQQTRKMATSPKKSRPCLSVAQKIKILDRLKQGLTRKTILDETGIGLRSLERINYR